MSPPRKRKDGACSLCGEVRSLSQMGRHAGHCITCARRENSRIWREVNRERKREIDREYYDRKAKREGVGSCELCAEDMLPNTKRRRCRACDHMVCGDCADRDAIPGWILCRRCADGPDDLDYNAGPADECPTYRKNMIDAGRGHLLR